MASPLRRAKLWNSFVPPLGFESPRTAELKFQIFFATVEAGTWWHPTEVAIRVGSSDINAARQLCLKLAASGLLDSAACCIRGHVPQTGAYTLDLLVAARAENTSAARFVAAFRAKGNLRAGYNSGALLGRFRIPNNDRRSAGTKIFEYLIEYPEPITLERLKRVIRESEAQLSQFIRLIRGLVSRRRLELVRGNAQSEMQETYQMSASEWLKQETKRREREEQTQKKKALALRKRRRTLKKKAKKRKRPSRKGALEL